MALTLGAHTFADDRPLVMAIVNRTPDSFFDRGATWAEDKAFERVAEAVEEGAEIVDIGGVRAGYGPDVDADEEVRRVGGFVRRVREAHPDLVISVDTWRSEVAEVVCGEGADVTPGWSRSPPPTAPPSSAPTPAASPRAPTRSGRSTTTWSPPRSRTPSPWRRGRWPPVSAGTAS